MVFSTAYRAVARVPFTFFIWKPTLERYLCMYMGVSIFFDTGVSSRGSSVSILSDYRLDDRAAGLDRRQRQRIFRLTSVSRPAVIPTHPSVQWSPRVLSPEVKSWLGRDADDTHPSSAEIK
jgi:hypothetical protein